MTLFRVKEVGVIPAREVGGMISAKRRKKTVNATRIEMLRVTFSPQSDGR